MRRHLRTMIEQRDRGAALILVIGIGALVTALLTTAIVVAVSGARHARDDADWQGALSAAYAGVEEYQSRLAADPGYLRYGNASSPFTASSTVIADATNAAFGIGAAGTWASVPGSAGTAEFRYEIDISTFDSDGTIRLRSTGRVGDETRTVVADLRQAGFLNYLYFTDYEIEDPALNGQPDSCVRYAWAGRLASCGATIVFSGGDQIRGQVHSNDVIHACDATFYGPVSTAYNPPTGERYVRSGSGCNPDFRVKDPARGNSPALLGVLGMPETNSEIRTDALDGGCLYTGPTTVTLNSNGTMTVRSPWTKVTRPGAAVPVPTACGRVGTASGQLGHSAGATIPVPNGGAVFVQNVPTSTTDPNGWRSNQAPHTCPTNGNGVGYPTSGETVPAAIDGTAAYGCRNGDLFIQGRLQGQVTFATENYLYVVGNTTYVDRDRDMLGLIGQGMVWVRNPRINSYVDSPNRTIDAAILSLHSFAVQNTDKTGDRNGTLTVRGSIAQSFRGIVAQSSGYIKDYQYDARLRFRSPPHFLSPVTTAYGVTTWIETSPAMDATGGYR